MEKLSLALLLCFIASTGAALGQGEEIMKITDDRGKDVVTMRTPGSTSADFDLSISGFNVGFRTGMDHGSHNERHKKIHHNSGRRYKNPIGLLEFGINTFTDSDYTIHSPSGDYRMEHNPWKSGHIQWNILRFSEPLNRAKTLGFSTALGLAWDRYKFDNYYSPDADCRTTKRGKCNGKVAKLNTFSFTMPLMIGANLNRMVIGAGIYGTVSVRQKHKNMLKGMEYEMGSKRFVSRVNPDAGVMATFGFRSVKFYAKYSFRNFSDSRMVPKTDVMSFGISLF